MRLPTTHPNVACGDYAVNTIQPANPPHGSGALLPPVDATKYPTIGDRLMAAKVSWNWYSGGWNDAAAGHPGPLFQYHHQPLIYFSSFAPGQPGRAHLKDETEFVAAARRHPADGELRQAVRRGERAPGYASEANGSDHLVDLIQTITSGPQAKTRSSSSPTTSSAGSGTTSRRPARAAAPAACTTRSGPVPASRRWSSARRCAAPGVDHTVYDTTSILATIEHGLDLAPLSSRDARVADLRHALVVGGVRRH